MDLQQPQFGPFGLHHNRHPVWITQTQCCAPFDPCPTFSLSNHTTQRPYPGPNHESAPTSQDKDIQVDAVQADQGRACPTSGLHRQQVITVINASLPTQLCLSFTTRTHAEISRQLLQVWQSCKKNAKDMTWIPYEGGPLGTTINLIIHLAWLYDKCANTLTKKSKYGCLYKLM